MSLLWAYADRSLQVNVSPTPIGQSLTHNWRAVWHRSLFTTFQYAEP